MRYQRVDYQLIHHAPTYLIALNINSKHITKCINSTHIQPFYGIYTGQNWRILLQQRLTARMSLQIMHSDYGEDAKVLLNAVIYTVSLPLYFSITAHYQKQKNNKEMCKKKHGQQRY